MLGGLGNLMGVLKQAKEFQGRMEEVRAELPARSRPPSTDGVRW
jgi:hypothetical protein